jgi:hypothetical protein
MTDAPCIERVTLRIVSPNFGFASIRLPGVLLSGIEARRDGFGRVTLTCPSKPDRTGQPRSLFTLQPGTAEAAAEAVAEAWANACRASSGVH